jgi:hypothetical protein
LIAASLGPNITRVAPVKCEPAIVTSVPPVTGPVFAESPATDGRERARARLWYAPAAMSGACPAAD